MNKLILIAAFAMLMVPFLSCGFVTGVSAQELKESATRSLIQSLRSMEHDDYLAKVHTALEQGADCEEPIRFSDDRAPLKPIEFALIKGNEALLALLLKHRAKLSGSQIVACVIHGPNGFNIPLLIRLVAVVTPEDKRRAAMLWMTVRVTSKQKRKT